MFRLSGFADEISSDLTEQLDVLDSLQIKFMELRGVWGKNVADFSDAEVAAIRDALQTRGLGVSCIGSPIGKVKITDDFAAHLVKFRRIMEIAQMLKTRYIRIFSFFMPEGENPADYRDEVMRRMQTMVDEAAAQKLVLLHENERHIYGDTGERCRDILQTINSPNLRAIFDPANFVQVGQRPYAECWSALQPYVDYMHIKDAVLETGKVVPAGEGDGGLKAIVTELQKSGFHGFTSLEPHLSVAGRMAGFSGPDLFRLAAQKYKELLSAAGVTWA